MKKYNYRFIVTSGPTREFVDPIRFLSNPSTGRMGYQIARAAVNQGYQVSYITGPVDNEFAEVPMAKNISIISTENMLEAVKSEITEKCVLIMAAAPADYKPKIKFEHKMKKSDATEITLIPNPDILKTIGGFAKEKGFKEVIKVGFAAETQRVEEYARKKLVEKDLDLILLNDVSAKDAGFGGDNNQLTVIRRDSSIEEWPKDSKERLSYRIINEVEKIIS